MNKHLVDKLPPEIIDRLERANLTGDDVAAITIESDVHGLPPRITAEVFHPVELTSLGTLPPDYKPGTYTVDVP